MDQVVLSSALCKLNILNSVYVILYCVFTLFVGIWEATVWHACVYLQVRLFLYSKKTYIFNLMSKVRIPGFETMIFGSMVSKQVARICFISYIL